MKFNFVFVALLSLCLSLFTGCAEESRPATAGPFDASNAYEPTESTYLSGRNFCSTYNSITQKENGRYISVPRDYNNPSAGTLEIYAWSVQPFDASKPTVVFVDGGPGATSHGVGTILNGDWNEIHIDQRGLGCSAPASYSEYRNPKIYSSEFNALDMEQVRQAFNIPRWSVFGSSYGTIPATIYASNFGNFTTAVVLEGTVFDSKDIHNTEWKVNKYNEVFSRLTSAQIDAFEELAEQERYARIFVVTLSEIVYSNRGFRKLLSFFNKAISQDGKINYAFLEEVERSLFLSGEAPQFPQNPKSIDFQVHKVLFCKELGERGALTDWQYDPSRNRFTKGTKTFDPGKRCTERGVEASDETPYVASRYPISVPVTYFQGSHDGATLARGAIRHWQNVPKGIMNFLLRTKGGHGPNLSNIIFTQDMNLRALSLRLMYRGLMGQTIQESEVAAANAIVDELDRWILFHNPPNNIREIDEHLDGISVRLFQSGN